MLKKIITTLLITCTFLVNAQDIHFSQINESPLWLNPANAGMMNGYFRATAQYRSQWAAMGNAFQTMGVSLDAIALKTTKNKAYLGIGMMVFNDKAGVAKLGNTLGQLHLNAILKASDNSKICGGMYIGFNQNTAKYGSLTFENQYDGKTLDNTLSSGENVGYLNFTTTDVGAGVNYEFSNAKVDMQRDDVFSFKVGGAVHHLNQPTMKYSANSNYRLPMRFVGQVESRIDFKGSRASMHPSLIYLQQAKATQITVGTHFMVRFKNGTKKTGAITETGLSFGLFYRVKDAVIPQFKLDLGKYAVGLAYDINISTYKQASMGKGGMEIFLKIMSLDHALFQRKREHSIQ